MHLRWKYAEIMTRLSPIGIVFCFLDDPRFFSPYFITTINTLIDSPRNNKRVYKIISKDKKEYPENTQLHDTLLKLGGIISTAKPVPNEGYDVFISYKSEDQIYANRIYDLLIQKGYKVFFSKETLPALGSDDYHREIDGAINRTKNMIVVTTSSENITSKWVDYEWRLFLGELLAGRKTGNLVTILVGKMCIPNLPISLRNREAIMFDEMHKVLSYIKL